MLKSCLHFQTKLSVAFFYLGTWSWSL